MSGSQAGRFVMTGTFESRRAVFVFGFHAKKGLNHKSAYIASSGDPDEDRKLYDALREAYSTRFGKTDERLLPNPQGRKGGGERNFGKGPGISEQVALSSVWKPDRYTVVSLSYNPAAQERFPGASPGDRPVRLVYNYTKWTR
jgi:hypothetical protein